MGKLIAIIIILVLALALVISIVCIVNRVRRKVRQVSNALFGTNDLMQGIQKRNAEIESTPKSVSAITSLALPNIIADFPDFQYDEMKVRAENVLTGYLRAITEKDTGLLKDCNYELKEKLTNHLQMLDSQGQRERFDQIKIHRTEISNYTKRDGRCIITFQSSLQCYHSVTDDSNRVIKGSKEARYQTRFNTDLIYIQDRDLVENDADKALAMNCPNCGAPLETLGAKVCQYCDSPVLEFNIHAWTFADVEEC